MEWFPDDARSGMRVRVKDVLRKRCNDHTHRYVLAKNGERVLLPEKVNVDQGTVFNLTNIRTRKICGDEFITGRIDLTSPSQKDMFRINPP